MTLVIDASVLVSAVASNEPDGRWAASLAVGEHLVAPHLILVEAHSTLRRMNLQGHLAEDRAVMSLTQIDLMDIEYYPFRPFARRVWELRHTVTPYDAWYVALAEELDCPLATLDRRLRSSSGPRCTFVEAPDF